MIGPNKTDMPARQIAQGLAKCLRSFGIKGYRFVNEIHDRIAQPIQWYRDHPNWPSELSFEGVPIEVSVSMDGDVRPSVRYSVDLTDLRTGLGGNWFRYIRGACAKVPSANRSIRLWRLMAQHLDGCSPTFRTMIAHGVRYGSDGTHQMSLYFPIGDASLEEFERRFAVHIRAIRRNMIQYERPKNAPLRGVSYDFDENAAILRTKYYGWLALTDKTRSLSELTGDSCDLIHAAELFSYFLRQGGPRQAQYSTLIQLAFNKQVRKCEKKLIFMCGAWGCEQGSEFLDVITFLSQRFGLTLWPLYSFLSSFTAVKIKLRPSAIAIGGGTPRLTFYFVPRIQECHTTPRVVTAKGKVQAEDSLINDSVGRAEKYLLKMREDAGCWMDFNSTSLDPIWVTALITRTLASNLSLHKPLNSTGHWLRKQLLTRRTINVESVGLALLALHRLQLPLPEKAIAALLRRSDPMSVETHAITALAQIECGVGDPAQLDTLIRSLIARQRSDGGWQRADWKDDLFSTNSAVLALRGLLHFANHETWAGKVRVDLLQEALRAIRWAGYFIEAFAVASEPMALGLWLQTWFATRSASAIHGVHRSALHLHAQQQRDGSWLSIPTRYHRQGSDYATWARVESGRMYMDSQRLVTTTCAVEGLLVIRDFLVNDDRARNTVSNKEANT